MATTLRAVLTGEQREELVALAGSRYVDGVVSTRARIVLWWDEGRPTTEIAALANMSAPTVRLWPARYLAGGAQALLGLAHPGRPRQVDPVLRGKVLALSRQSPPPQLGVSHWSSRLLADHVTRTLKVAVSHTWVADLWREVGLKPWRIGTFKLSKDPAFEEKVTDVVGLYLNPPAGAVVLSVDEKSQCQALDRTAPVLPMPFGVTEKRTHDYIRHGTTTLFGALEVGTGQLQGACYDSHTAIDFLDFMDKVAERHAGREVHVVLDSFSTHKTEAVRTWLADHPAITFHFTPVAGSWLNQTEIFFGILTKQAIRRGTFTSVRDLTATIDRFIASWNTKAKPFTWTADAPTILEKVKFVESQVRKLTGH